MSFEEERRSEPGRCQNVRYVERPSSDPRSERVDRIYFEERNSLDRPDSVPNPAPGSKQYENTTWSRDANDGPLNNKMGNDQYCLRWNSYETNILSTFEGLLDSEALSDVTLFCEGESFKAHRLVLAACSSHFSKLFSNSSLNGQLIVILDGTRHQDLQILLQFMYRGVAYLHQDRIESVLRTAEVLQVKGLSDGGVDGVGVRNNGDTAGPNARPWSPPPGGPGAGPPPDGLKEEMKQPIGPRTTSPRPSGRIAMPADSPIPPNQMPPPIFPSHGYPRNPLTTMYQSFGFTRPESSSMKPTSTSALSFPSGSRKSELPSPGSRDTSQYSKFDPLRGERERDDLYESASGSTNRTKDFDQAKSPNQDLDRDRDRSPPSNLRRPSSSEQFDLHSPRPKQMTSDSTTDKGGSPPQAPRRYDDDQERTTNRIHDHVKSERSSTPPLPESRPRSFSGDFSRDSLSHISSQSAPNPRPDSLIAQSMAAQECLQKFSEKGRPANVPPSLTPNSPATSGPQGPLRLQGSAWMTQKSWQNAKNVRYTTASSTTDLRTNDQEERIKRETNLEKFETLRRMAASASFAQQSNMATIQKLEMFQQSREAFMPPGGFTVPLTAPLGIPASDLARIAQTVPDPAANGEPTSGTGTKLKCPFCERTYGYETNLRAHIRQRHQGIRVPCPFCHRSFTRNNTVRRHIAREHRHQVNPKMIPQKFGQTKVMPDQPFQDHLNLQNQAQP